VVIMLAFQASGTGSIPVRCIFLTFSYPNRMPFRPWLQLHSKSLVGMLSFHPSFKKNCLLLTCLSTIQRVSFAQKATMPAVLASFPKKLCTASTDEWLAGSSCHPSWHKCEPGPADPHHPHISHKLPFVSIRHFHPPLPS
jgi:hypothetical protein